ncbi:MAG: A/G-specific adenine glycosylase [Christensenella sp.]|nr:A/G-specific adenine glycosylase [Christensenella sp.]
MRDYPYSKIPTPLLAWYDAHARSLPWRDDPSPYRVWVSEIMLQQTRVEAVKPYFSRFLKALPDVRALAQVSDEALMKLWEGLGYYSRARNLKKAAQIIVSEEGGALPSSFDMLKKLPGIGEYTAGAISSIAFGQCMPAVDGNVLRVFSRLTECRDNIMDPKTKRFFSDKIQGIIPIDRAGDFNQALMELGAMVCKPNGIPLCGACPLAPLCRAEQNGTAGEFPVKSSKKPRRIEEKTVFLIICGKKAALLRRGEGGLLAGMWEFPNTPGFVSSANLMACLAEYGITSEDILEIGALPPAKHIFTHIEWHMTGFLIQLHNENGNFFWSDQESLQKRYAVPSAFHAYGKYLTELFCK